MSRPEDTTGQASRPETRARVTGIGSLPLVDPGHAVRFVAETCPEIPFWPQLPRRSIHETMVDQALSAVEDCLSRRKDGSGFDIVYDRCGEMIERLSSGRGGFDLQHASGYFAFEEALRAGVFTRAVAVKGQIAGPITVALQVFDGDRPLFTDPVFLEALALHLASAAAWQIERLSRTGAPVILVIDEPCLGMIEERALLSAGGSAPSALRKVTTAVREAGGMSGLHCCAAFPFAVLGGVKPDLVSFDADAGLEAFFSDPEAARFIRDGGSAAFGLIPTRPRSCDAGSGEAPQCEGSGSAAAIAGRFISAATSAGAVSAGFPPPSDYLDRTLITATCGLAFLDENDARESIEKAREVASLIEH